MICHKCAKRKGMERKQGSVTARLMKCPTCGKHKVCCDERHFNKSKNRVEL